MTNAVSTIFVIISFTFLLSIATSASGADLIVTPAWSYSVTGVRDIEQARDLIVISISGGELAAVTADGSKAWAMNLGGEPISNIAVVGDHCAVVHSAFDESGAIAGAVLRVVKCDTGLPVWYEKLAASEEYSLIGGVGMVAAVPRSGPTVGFGIPGKSLLPGPPAKTYLDDRPTAYSPASIQLEGFPVQNGMERPDAALHAVGTERGYLRVSDAAGRIRWKFKTGAAIAKVVAGADLLLAASNDNFLYAFDPDNGDVRWKKRLAGRVTSLSLIDDSYVAVAGTEDEEMYFFEAAKGRRAGQIIFGPDETVVSDSLMHNGTFVIPTTKGVRAYKLTGLDKK